MQGTPLNYDADGNALVAEYSVRGGLITANATLTTGTATALIAGDADYFLDLVEISLGTTSSVALGTASFNVTLINDGTTQRKYTLDDGFMEQFTHKPPLPQVTKNTPWNIQLDDVTGTTVNVFALFIKRNK